MSRRKREAMEGLGTSLSESNVDDLQNSSPTGKKNWLGHLTGTRRWLALGIVAFLAIGILGAGLKYLEDSTREQGANSKSGISLASLNPFAPAPTPTPTPLPLSKQYIYAGARLLAVKDAGVDAVAPTDLAVWRPGSGVWYCLGGQGSQGFQVAWGNGALEDRAVPGDYDGDSKTDLAVWRPVQGGTGTWWIYRSSDGSYYTVTLGSYDAQPAQADYDGDGKTDPAVFYSGTWYVFQSSTQSTVNTAFGLSTDTAAPADYDGDGKSDRAVWRNSTATFYVLKSSDGQWNAQGLGQTDDKPVPGDYDGDGRADLATWRGSDNKWRIQQSSNAQTITTEWGVRATDIAVQSDYDGDGKCDIAVWRASGTYTGYWFILKSSNGQMRMELWGQANDIPVPSKYRR